MATYFGKSQIVHGNFNIGIIQPFQILRLRAILQGNYTPYDELMLYTQKQFMQDGKTSMHYNQSWAMIHFLIHGQKGRYRPLINKYLKALKQGKSQQAAFDRTFANINFSTLESRLITYFREMKTE